MTACKGHLELWQVDKFDCCNLCSSNHITLEFCYVDYLLSCEFAILVTYNARVCPGGQGTVQRSNCWVPLRYDCSEVLGASF